MSEKEYSVCKVTETKIANVIKRDGTLVPFDSDKIYNAIRKAGESTGEFGEQESYLLTAQVLKVLDTNLPNRCRRLNVFRMWLNKC